MVKNTYYKRLFLIFFFTYFSISIANIYVVTFIPFYFLEVINVNRSSLAFIRLLISVPLLLPIFTGFLYDRYITNVKRLNLIFSIFFTVSFLIFIVDPQNLSFFGAFYVVNLISQFMIRGGMTKIFMALTITNKPHYTESIREFRIQVKNNFLLILNIGSIFGSTLTAIASICISNLREQSDWNMFFLCGFLFSLPIFISSMIFQKIKLPCLNLVSKIPTVRGKTKMRKRIKIKALYKFIPIFLLYMTFFLNDSSLLNMIYLSWFSERFGDVFIRTVFIFLPVSYVLMMIGNLFVARYLNKLRTLKKMSPESLFCIIGILCKSFLILLVILSANPFIVFFLFFILLPFLGSLETLSLASTAQKISQEGKHPTLRMQFISTANSLASMIFSPIGLILSTIVSINHIFFIQLVFYGFSLIPILLLSRGAEKTKRRKRKPPNLVLLEEFKELKKR